MGCPAWTNWQSLLFVAPAGIAITGVFAFPNALMADIIDYDALRTGERREALYYGVQNTVEKKGRSMFILAALFLIGDGVNPFHIRLVGPVRRGGAGFCPFRVTVCRTAFP
jgi:GPH family glycoside/pentoside/hexuronide:cation symporter